MKIKVWSYQDVNSIKCNTNVPGKICPLVLLCHNYYRVVNYSLIRAESYSARGNHIEYHKFSPKSITEEVLHLKEEDTTTD